MAKSPVVYVYGPTKIVNEFAEIKWRFVGQLKNGQLDGWVLTYNAHHRTFRARNRPVQKQEHNVAMQDALFCPPSMRHENLTGKTITQRLKNCLSPEQLASAVALSVRISA